MVISLMLFHRRMAGSAGITATAVMAFALNLLASHPAAAWVESDLNAFHTDGCSWAPEGSHSHRTLLRQCCYQHDRAYYAGGSSDDRLNADLALASCVERRTGSATLASTFFYGVRIGGRPKPNADYRWGKAWPYARGYQALSADEKRIVANRLRDVDCHAENKYFTEDPEELRDICGY